MSPAATPSKVVLVTGCSTGIGRATAEHLARAGWTVYATARKIDALAGLEDAGCRLLALDVTDEASMQAAVDAIEAEHGAVGVLINNAGYSQSGAVETVSMDDLRRQFETNVFGLVRLTQLVLPKMRAQRWGRIVNITSITVKEPAPNMVLSNIFRSAVVSFAKTISKELIAKGITINNVAPGYFKTDRITQLTQARSQAEGIFRTPEPNWPQRRI